MAYPRYLGGVSLEGGSVTAVSHLQTFVLCMAYHPEIQARAHQELDRVVGQSRMPTLEDYDQLPFIQAIAKEVCDLLEIRLALTVFCVGPQILSSCTDGSSSCVRF